MSAMPRFFFLSAVAGVALWFTHAPYPFPVLAVIIMAASAAGFVLSALYVRAFMPAEWREKVAALRRVVGHPAPPVKLSHPQRTR